VRYAGNEMSGPFRMLIEDHHGMEKRNKRDFNTGIMTCLNSMETVILLDQKGKIHTRPMAY